MATTNLKLTLKFEPAPQTTALLNEVLAAAQESLPENVAQVFDFVLNSLERRQQLFSIKSNFGAARAHELVIRLDPGDGLVLLAAAVRAWKGQGLIIEDIHGFSPVGGIDCCVEAQS